MTVLPRALLFRVLAGIVAVAITVATAEAAFVYQAMGPIIAAALGVALCPALLRGASSGSMHVGVAWAIAGVAVVICAVATIGLDPARMDWITISWYPCGVLAGAVMVWMAGHPAPPLVAVACLLAQLTAWAGPIGVLRLGVAVEVVLVVAGLMMHRAMRRVTEAAAAAAVREREIAAWQAEQDAFYRERQTRLRRASRNAAPMLTRIVDLGGHLDEVSRTECRILEQTLRDEIRGRRLLNDHVRRVVLAHRQRGAFVQVLDDGGLDDLRPRELTSLLNDLARKIASVRSTRIVIRTGQPGSSTAITAVATSPDETAVALGLDEDEQVDLWVTIPRPSAVSTPA